MKLSDNINYPAPKQEFKVLVRCFTYNHSKYIEDTLNGFAMQQTNFPFVCLVMDDASTDAEQVVITEWMQRECDVSRADTIDIPTSIVYIVPHKANPNCSFAFYLLKQNLYGTGDKKMNHVYPWRKKCKYEAICEGDDYWIDSMKLQKQVDFLENHEEVGLVYTGYKKYIQSADIYSVEKSKYYRGCVFERLLCGNFIPTLTVCYRVSLLDSIDTDYQTRKFLMGDYPLWLEFSRKAKFDYLTDITSVYRVLETSASHSKDFSHVKQFNECEYSIKEYFISKYGSAKSLKMIKRETLVNLVRKASFFSKNIFFSNLKEAIQLDFTILFNARVIYSIILKLWS